MNLNELICNTLLINFAWTCGEIVCFKLKEKKKIFPEGISLSIKKNYFEFRCSAL